MAYHGAPGFNAEKGEPSYLLTTNNGFRAWRMLDVGKGTLTSLVRNHDWLPGKQTCNCGQPDPVVNWAWGALYYRNIPNTCEHPTKDCSHGFYAYYTEDYYRDVSTGFHPTINGIMEGWGRCVIGEKGFRSQYAIISAFIEPFEIGPRWLEQNNLTEAQAREAVRAGLEKAYPTVPIFPSVEQALAIIPLRGKP